MCSKENTKEKVCEKEFGEGRLLVSSNTGVNGFFNNSVPRSNREAPAKSTARSGKCHIHVTAREIPWAATLTFPSTAPEVLSEQHGGFRTCFFLCSVFFSLNAFVLLHTPPEINTSPLGCFSPSSPALPCSRSHNYLRRESVRTRSEPLKPHCRQSKQCSGSVFL